MSHYFAISHTGRDPNVKHVLHGARVCGRIEKTKEGKYFPTILAEDLSGAVSIGVCCETQDAAFDAIKAAILAQPLPGSGSGGAAPIDPAGTKSSIPDLRGPRNAGNAIYPASATVLPAPTFAKPAFPQGSTRKHTLAEAVAAGGRIEVTSGMELIGVIEIKIEDLGYFARIVRDNGELSAPMGAFGSAEEALDVIKKFFCERLRFVVD